MITMIIKDTLQTAFIKKDLFFKIYFFLFYGQHQLKCSLSSSFESADTFFKSNYIWSFVQFKEEEEEKKHLKPEPVFIISITVTNVWVPGSGCSRIWTEVFVQHKSMDFS